MISDDCPAGYILNTGDIPGWGQVGSNPSIEDAVSGCSERCNDEPQCCSFEYSKTEKKCSLNTGCSPTTGAYKDYAFCVRGTGK